MPAEAPVLAADGPLAAGEQLQQPAEVEFQYTGNGRLTVTGPITGAVYIFTAAGEPIAVNGADAPSLGSVPGLKMVSSLDQ